MHQSHKLLPNMLCYNITIPERKNYVMLKNNLSVVLLSKLGIGETIISELVKFKQNEAKDDPERRLGIHGPYEEIILRQTGRLPKDYYDRQEDGPWGLRGLESRSNILWQVLSGIIDNEPYFASSYMSLALDKALDDDSYAAELFKLNQDWGSYVDKSFLNKSHKHHSAGGHQHSLTDVYGRVACPACSVLTAVALRDAGMHAVFTEMLPLNAADRKAFLEEKGFAPLLDTMITDLQKPSLQKPDIIWELK